MKQIFHQSFDFQDRRRYFGLLYFVLDLLAILQERGSSVIFIHFYTRDSTEWRLFYFIYLFILCIIVIRIGFLNDKFFFRF